MEEAKQLLLLSIYIQINSNSHKYYAVEKAEKINREEKETMNFLYYLLIQN